MTLGSKIERIRDTEHQAMNLIQRAEGEGQILIELAHVQAKNLIQEKSQEAAVEVARLREQMLSSAEKEAEETRADAEKERDTIFLAVKNRIPIAVTYIQTRITGEPNAVSGRDE